MYKRLLAVCVCMFLINSVTADPPATKVNFLYKAYSDLKRQIQDCTGKYVCAITTYNQGLFGNSVTCVSKKKICDGGEDCELGIDEMDCKPKCGDRVNCADNYKCATPCDKAIECKHGEDESKCPNSCDCPAGTYRCTDGCTCVPVASVCNGNYDCPAGDDEIGCPNGFCNCMPGEMLCNNLMGCVPKSALCDNNMDCTDNSDEDLCPLGCRCNPNELLCLNGQRCLPRDRICALPEDECCTGITDTCPGDQNEDVGCFGIE